MPVAAHDPWQSMENGPSDQVAHFVSRKHRLLHPDISGTERYQESMLAHWGCNDRHLHGSNVSRASAQNNALAGAGSSIWSLDIRVQNQRALKKIIYKMQYVEGRWNDGKSKDKLSYLPNEDRIDVYISQVTGGEWVSHCSFHWKGYQRSSVLQGTKHGAISWWFPNKILLIFIGSHERWYCSLFQCLWLGEFTDS